MPLTDRYIYIYIFVIVTYPSPEHHCLLFQVPHRARARCSSSPGIRGVCCCPRRPPQEASGRLRQESGAQVEVALSGCHRLVPSWSIERSFHGIVLYKFRRSRVFFFFFFFFFFFIFLLMMLLDANASSRPYIHTGKRSYMYMHPQAVKYSYRVPYQGRT